MSRAGVSRLAITATAAVLLLPPRAPAAAQGLVLGGTPPPPPPGCLQVSVNGTVSYGCTDAQQQGLRDQHRAGQAAGVPNPGTAPPRLGLYNQAATREHLGTSFGHSVVPQAVPPPHYTTPLIPPR